MRKAQFRATPVFLGTNFFEKDSNSSWEFVSNLDAVVGGSCFFFGNERDSLFFLFGGSTPAMTHWKGKFKGTKQGTDTTEKRQMSSSDYWACALRLRKKRPTKIWLHRRAETTSTMLYIIHIFLLIILPTNDANTRWGGYIINILSSFYSYRWLLTFEGCF